MSLKRERERENCAMHPLDSSLWTLSGKQNTEKNTTTKVPSPEQFVSLLQGFLPHLLTHKDSEGLTLNQICRVRVPVHISRDSSGRVVLHGTENLDAPKMLMFVAGSRQRKIAESRKKNQALV